MFLYRRVGDHGPATIGLGEYDLTCIDQRRVGDFDRSAVLRRQLDMPKRQPSASSLGEKKSFIDHRRCADLAGNFDAALATGPFSAARLFKVQSDSGRHFEQSRSFERVDCFAEWFKNNSDFLVLHNSFIGMVPESRSFALPFQLEDFLLAWQDEMHYVRISS